MPRTSRSALPRRRTRPHLLLAVLLGHGLLVLGLLQATRPKRLVPAVASPVTAWLRWISAPAPAPAAAEAARPAKTPPAERPVPPRPIIPSAGEAAPITPAVAAPLALPAEGLPAPAAEPASAPKPAPLDLPWRRPQTAASAPLTAGDLLRNDPRQPPPLTRDERLARTLGTDTTLREEVLEGGKRRFRSGRGCVETRPTRAAQLDPFNQSVRPTPQLVEGCR